MKVAGLFALLALAVSVVLGIDAQSKGVGPRPATLATAVDASWYAALPLDPGRAASAFLERVPAAARARAVEVSEGWFPLF